MPKPKEIGETKMAKISGGLVDEYAASKLSEAERNLRMAVAYAKQDLDTFVEAWKDEDWEWMVKNRYLSEDDIEWEEEPPDDIRHLTGY